MTDERARDQPHGPAAQFPAAARPARDGDHPERPGHRPLPAGGAGAGRRCGSPCRAPRTRRPSRPDARHPAARRDGGARRSPASPTGGPSWSSAGRPATCRSPAPPICPPARLAFDPVAGLFGLAFTGARRAARRSGACAARWPWRSTGRRSPPRSACRASRRAPAWSRPASRSCPAPAQPDWAGGAAADAPRARRPRRSPSSALEAPAPAARRDARRAGLPAGLRPSAPRLAADRGRGRASRRRRAGRPAPRSTRSRRPISPAGICAISPARSSAVCDPAADEALLAARLAARPADRARAIRDRRPDPYRSCAVHPADGAGALVAGFAAADRLPAQPVRPASRRRA